MKKIFFPSWCIFISFFITAHTEMKKSRTIEDFCIQLKEIMNHAHNNFEELNTYEQQAPEFTDEDGYEEINFFDQRATLKLPGSKLSSVHLKTDYISFFGVYKTKNDAVKKIDSLKSQLSYCLKNYKVTNEPQPESPFNYPVRYVLKEIRNDKTTAQGLELYAEKLPDDRFKVRLMIKGFTQ
jgi:hypothetical protein